jgi:hypothetical protein
MGSGGLAVDAMAVGCLGRVERFFKISFFTHFFHFIAAHEPAGFHLKERV